MSFARLHKGVTYLIAGLGLFALALGQELSTPVVVACALAFLASLWAEGPMLQRARYVNAWTGAVVALLVVQVLRGVVYEATLALGVEFAAFLQISRLFNRRGAAEHQQIAVLAFLHLIAATVLSSSLSYAFAFLGFIVVTPWMLALSHLRREIEDNYPATGPQDEGQDSAIARVLASRRVVGPRFLLGTALLAVPLFLMTLTIFFLVPRVGQGFLTFNRSAGERVVGFGDQVELGGFGLIRDDPSVVLRVTPVPASEAEMQHLVLRMRGTSFDHYDGRRWSRTPAARSELPRSRYDSYVLKRRRTRADREYRIILDELDEPVVFLPSGTVEFQVDPRIVKAERIQRELTFGPGADIRYDASDDLGLMYQVYVGNQGSDRVLRPMGGERREAYLQMPPGHDRLARLANELTADAQNDRERAIAIRRFLHSDRFAYSLDQPLVEPDRNPLDVFLFEAHRGHCEYFATAMAIMLRAVGIPSRNVTGLVGGVYNSYGDYVALRQGDAHSWVEAFVEDRGWVTFDPTPPARAAAGPATGLWSDAYAMFDAIRTRWLTSVVGYDLRTQIGLMRRAARWASRFGGGGATDSRPEALRPQLVQAGKLALAIVLVALVVVAGIWRWRRRRQAAAIPPAQLDAVRLYTELERTLERQGLGRPAGRTPLAHAQALKQTAFDGSSAVEEVTQAYLRARYGGEPLGPDAVAAAEQALARVRQAPHARPSDT